MTINFAILSGRLTREPELNTTNSGRNVCNFTLAVQRSKEDAIFISCTAWQKKADLIAEYCRKGSKVVIAGRLDVDKFQDKDGNDREKTKIVVNDIEFMDAKGKVVSQNTESEEPQISDNIPF